jgi:Oxidoreductase family, NAD-binding Rossmann fold
MSACWKRACRAAIARSMASRAWRCLGPGKAVALRCFLKPLSCSCAGRCQWRRSPTLWRNTTPGSGAWRPIMPKRPMPTTPGHRCDVSRLPKPVDFDAVSNVTPGAFHAPLSLQCLKAGKHVLCEKPLALKYPDALRMVAAARKARRINMVTFRTGRRCPCSARGPGRDAPY